MTNDFLVFEKALPRGRFCVFKTRPDFNLIKVKQTHSSIALNESECDGIKEADAMFGKSDIPMAILTADCLPIVLIGKDSHAFIHAGWKGLQNNILKNEFIKNINPYYAFIGPHISALNYEVQIDFKNNFNDPEAFGQKDGKLFFSLLHVAKTQLESTYKGITIEESGICTFLDSNFHSYRRNKTKERNWNIYIP